MHFRTARHTHQLKPIIAFYTRVLGLEVLGTFRHHASYDGVFLGMKGRDWHLEFTTSSSPANHTFDKDDLLVFYPKHTEAYQRILENIRAHGIELIEPANPYWKEHGIMIKDPDGYNVVISKQKVR